MVFPLSGSSSPPVREDKCYHKSLAALHKRKKKPNNNKWSSPRYFYIPLLVRKPEITHPLLLSLLNQGNKWQLMTDSKSHLSFYSLRNVQQMCKYFALRLTRFYFHDTAATCLARAVLRDALCQHLLSTSHSAFSISTSLPPPPSPLLPFPLSLSQLIPAPAASPRPSPSACRSSSRGGCSLAVMTWETIMAAIM